MAGAGGEGNVWGKVGPFSTHPQPLTSSVSEKDQRPRPRLPGPPPPLLRHLPGKRVLRAEADFFIVHRHITQSSLRNYVTQEVERIHRGEIYDARASSGRGPLLSRLFSISRR